MFLEAQCALWEREPEQLQKLWEMDSKILGFTNEWITQREGISLTELLDDAHEAQKTLQEMIAWSLKYWEPITKNPAEMGEAAEGLLKGPAFSALEQKVDELPAQCTEYKLYAEHSGVMSKHAGLVSATCRTVSQADIEAQAVAFERPHHRTPPYHVLVDVLQLYLVYSSAGTLLNGLQEILKCEAFSVATIDNTFHHPPALGHAGVTIRVRVPVKGGREHVATICLLLRDLLDLYETKSPELEERINAILAVCAERSRITPDHASVQQTALAQWILQLLDRTEGMELIELDLTRKELARAEAAQVQHASSDLIKKDRLATLRKYVGALESRQSLRGKQRAEDLKTRQEVAERARRFKPPRYKEVPFGHHNPRLHDDLDTRMEGMFEAWSSWPSRGQCGRAADSVRIMRLAQPREDRSIDGQEKKALSARKGEIPSPPSMPKTMGSCRPRSPRTVSTSWTQPAKRTNPRKILGTLPRTDQTSWMQHVLPPEHELLSTSRSFHLPKSPPSKQLPEQSSL